MIKHETLETGTKVFRDRSVDPADPEQTSKHLADGANLASAVARMILSCLYQSIEDNKRCTCTWQWYCLC